MDLEAAKRNHPDEYGDGTCDYCDSGYERCVAAPFIAEIERIRLLVEQMREAVNVGELPDLRYYADQILGVSS